MREHHYKATIFSVKLSQIAGNCLNACGAFKNWGAKQRITEIVKRDLISILTDVVETSLYKFGRMTGPMAESLRDGIQVKGRTPVSIQAILHGVDYTLIHEEDVTLKPRKAKMLAIPLPDACTADGRPRFTGPRVWQSHFKTFVMNGAVAAERGLRQQESSGINPHYDDEVAYIVYKKGSGKDQRLVFLYKLVPYSLFKEGKTNVNGERLKKLGLEKRFYAAVASAWDNWYTVVMNELWADNDLSAMEAYHGAYVSNTVQPYLPNYSVPTGPTSTLRTVSAKMAGLANIAISINRS